MYGYGVRHLVEKIIFIINSQAVARSLLRSMRNADTGDPLSRGPCG